jgi:hypothetical protein
LHTAASVAVLKLVMYTQAILCPEEYVMLEWEYNPFSAVIISLSIYQPLLGFCNGDCTAPWEGNAYQHSPHKMLSSVPYCVLVLLYIFKHTSVFYYTLFVSPTS